MKKSTNHDKSRVRTRPYPINKSKRTSTITKKNAIGQKQETLCKYHRWIYAAEPDLILIIGREINHVSKPDGQSGIFQIATDSELYLGDKIALLNLSKNKGVGMTALYAGKLKTYGANSSEVRAFNLIKEDPDNPLIKDFVLELRVSVDGSKEFIDFSTLPDSYKLTLKEYDIYKKLFDQWKAGKQVKDSLQT